MASANDHSAIKKVNDVNGGCGFVLFFAFLSPPILIDPLIASMTISFGLIGLLALIYKFLIHNIQVELFSRIEALRATLNASLERKKDLQKSVISLASSIAETERSTHTRVVEELRASAAELADSQHPSVVLANLSSRFPALNNFQGFLMAQKSASEIENRIDIDVKEINGEIAIFNQIVDSFPSSFFSSSNKLKYSSGNISNA